MVLLPPIHVHSPIEEAALMVKGPLATALLAYPGAAAMARIVRLDGTEMEPV
jgi:hypothetical protein